MRIGIVRRKKFSPSYKPVPWKKPNSYETIGWERQGGQLYLSLSGQHVVVTSLNLQVIVPSYLQVKGGLPLSVVHCQTSGSWSLKEVKTLFTDSPRKKNSQKRKYF